MKNTIKKIWLNVLVIHGLGINVVGAILFYLLYRPENTLMLGICWLVSFQANAFCFYYYKKRYPEEVDASKNMQRSPWLSDLFSNRAVKE